MGFKPHIRAQSARTGRPPPNPEQETASSSSEPAFEERPRSSRSSNYKPPPESYYVRLYVHYRGITIPQEIVLTGALTLQSLHPQKHSLTLSQLTRGTGAHQHVP
eukprot:1190319-Prorocentrum_minimum.AAC.3